MCEGRTQSNRRIGRSGRAIAWVGDVSSAANRDGTIHARGKTHGEETGGGVLRADGELQRCGSAGREFDARGTRGRVGRGGADVLVGGLVVQGSVKDFLADGRDGEVEHFAREGIVGECLGARGSGDVTCGKEAGE